MRTVLLVLGLSFLAACERKEDLCTSGSQTFHYSTNKSVDTAALIPNVVAGDRTVFEFRDRFEQCPGLVGGGEGRSIYFEIPSTLRSDFNYTDSASLAQAKTILFRNSGINPRLRLSVITEGSIQGTRMGDAWHIKAALKAGAETINFEADFKED